MTHLFLLGDDTPASHEEDTVGVKLDVVALLHGVGETEQHAIVFARQRVNKQARRENR